MATPAAKGGLGWAILAAALAVPGFLFYNWWSHLKAERLKTISLKARGRVPAGGVFALPAPSAVKLVNPVAVATAAPAAAAPGTVPDALAVSSAAPAAVLSPAAAAPVDVVAQSSAPEVAALPRDPMLSPMDIVRIQQEELERSLAEERMKEELISRSKPRVIPEIRIETYVDLQGIVANPDGGSKAIVNDVVVGVGETFEARGRQVRVLKITAAGVTFQYKNKRFVKHVSRDE